MVFMGTFGANIARLASMGSGPLVVVLKFSLFSLFLI